VTRLTEEQLAIKEGAREAIKEFLDEKLAAFGWWSAKSLGALTLAALVYFILKMGGWTR
jgi:hypothetical protein